MDIYIKCSFKYGIGYRIGKYSVDSDTLTYISGKDESVRLNMPRVVADTLNYELGRSVILATDEHGQLFMGVYHLILGDYEKYVNAVFVGKTPQDTFRLFLYFCCKNYCGAGTMLLNSIARDAGADTETGFAVDGPQIQDLLNRVQKLSCDNVSLDAPPASLLAFVSRETYQDYQIALHKIFMSPPGILHENIGDDSLQAVPVETIESALAPRKKKWIQIAAVLLLICAIIAVITICFISMDNDVPKSDPPLETSQTGKSLRKIDKDGFITVYQHISIDFCEGS